MRDRNSQSWSALPLEQLLKEQALVTVRMIQAQTLKDRKFYVKIYSDLSEAISFRVLLAEED